MTIYTGSFQPESGQPLNNTQSGNLESLQENFKSGFNDGPVNSVIQYANLKLSQHDLSTPVISKDEADKKLRENGIDVDLPSNGVTQSYLDNIIDINQERRKSQSILDTAPTGFFNSSSQFLATLAGGMADPGNVALGFIGMGPVSAVSRLGRLGQRFAKGAAAGGIQSAATIPFRAAAMNATGQEYTFSDAASEILFSAGAGGAMHSLGGFIGDTIRKRKAVDSPSQTPEPSVVDQDISNYAYAKAYNDVTQDIMSGDRPGWLDDNVAHLKDEHIKNQEFLDTVDSSLKDRTREYQDQQMTFKEARKEALRDIAQEKQSIIQRQSEIDTILSEHSKVTDVDNLGTSIREGNFSDEVLTQIDQRANGIIEETRSFMRGYGVQRSAYRQFEEAPQILKVQSMRGAIAQAMRGDDINVSPFFDLNNPNLRAGAMEQLSTFRQKKALNSLVEKSSKSRDTDHLTNDNIEQATNDFGFEVEKLKSIVDENTPQPILDELNDITASSTDEGYINGLRAFATCMLSKV